MGAFKQQCVDLRRKDYTLSEIVRATGRPKASVFFHIRDIPLSKEKQEAIREASRVLASKLSERRRGKSTRPFKGFSRWDRKTVSLIAHLLFDGEIQRSGCAYSNRNLSLIKKVERLMVKVYSFEPRRSRNRATGVFRIMYFNVELGAYLREKARVLLSEITDLPRELKTEFLRAFFDDEGCMDFSPKQNTRRIRGYQKNVEILYLVQRLLADLGIPARVRKPNEVVVARKENLFKFQKEINFSLGVRINGKRSNSTWKKHLEKRDILARALASFRK